MSFFGKIFGKAEKGSPVTTGKVEKRKQRKYLINMGIVLFLKILGEAIQKLRETEEMLNKKQDFLGQDNSSNRSNRKRVFGRDKSFLMTDHRCRNKYGALPN